MTSPDAAAKIGTLVAIVGASGAGKDTLMDYAHRILAGDDRYVFLLRAITREDMAGEIHIALSHEEFAEYLARGDFAVSWQAHGQSYGIPANAVQQVRSGKIVIVNGSRSALEKFEKAFDRIHVVEVVARPEILAERLAARGRESEAEIRERLERTPPDIAYAGAKSVIENNGTVEEAGDRLVNILRQLAAAA